MPMDVYTAGEQLEGFMLLCFFVAAIVGAPLCLYGVFTWLMLKYCPKG
jgi:hypothetical protein